jgi:hypothetical protein
MLAKNLAVTTARITALEATVATVRRQGLAKLRIVYQWGHLPLTLLFRDRTVLEIRLARVAVEAEAAIANATEARIAVCACTDVKDELQFCEVDTRACPVEPPPPPSPACGCWTAPCLHRRAVALLRGMHRQHQ